MAGTKEGGKKAAARNLEKDPDFYAKIGKKGGSNGRTGGFAADVDCECSQFPFSHYVRNCAGKRGGTTSRRAKAAKTVA